MFIVEGKLPPDYTSDDVENMIRDEAPRAVRRMLSAGFSWRYKRLSLDARTGRPLHYALQVEVYLKNEQLPPKNVIEWPTKFPAVGKLVGNSESGAKQSNTSMEHPIVVGLGPAGIFAALYLARAGFKPIVIEQGKPAYDRLDDVHEFWQTGHLNPFSNVQFGEGGAGTFSDGKLHTGIKSPWIKTVLQTFVAAGADDEILYSSHPHIGTDRLPEVITNVRKMIETMGGEVRFNAVFERLIVEDNRVCGIIYHDAITGRQTHLAGSEVVLAIGHSSRETYFNLAEQNVPMQAKPMAIGVRIEHPQELIDFSQYKSNYEKYKDVLPPSPYKLTCRVPNGRAVYSFCMCPGGEVIAAASQSGEVVTNGMSNSRRDGYYANSALLVNVTPTDYQSFVEEHGENISDAVLKKWAERVKCYPELAGIFMQEYLEHACFERGGRTYAAPVMLLKDFMPKNLKLSLSKKTFEDQGETYRPGVKYVDFISILPKYIITALQYGITSFAQKILNFDYPLARLYAVESRSSSPVRLNRDENRESSLAGLYPVGEGAGYAGGITSAAVDGLRSAEEIVRRKNEGKRG